MNSPKIRKVLAYIAFLAVLVVSATIRPGNNVLAADSTVTQTQQQLTQSQKLTDSLRKSLTTKLVEEKNAMEQYEKVEEELRVLQAQIKTQDTKIKTAQKELDEIENNYKVTEMEIAELEVSLAKRSDEIAELLNRVYRSGNPTYLEVLFASEDLGEFLANYKYVGQIVTSQNDIFMSVKEDKLNLEDKRNLLIQDRENMEAKKLEIEATRAELKKEEAKVAEKTEEREYYLELLRKDIDVIRKELDAEEKRAKDLEKQIQDLQRGNTTANYSGTYIWPVTTGRISSEYGWRIHPVEKNNRLHAGIDIAVPTGTTVYAAAAGKVITASFLSGYGNTVIIDHGGKISTLYAHNKTLLVSVGQMVKQGDRVALSGSTGTSTGPHCHFEVRINGVAQNPRNYLPPR